jgi:hypothetical protein
MTSGAYIRSEKLDSEQWIGAGAIVWQVVDPGKVTAASTGVVHQVGLIPILKKTRCRIWGLLHGYGWLAVRA